MGLIELILGLLLVAIIANLFLSIVPLPDNILGTLIGILLLLLAWRIVF